MKAIEKPQVIITTFLFILIAIIFLMLTTTGCVNNRIEGNHDPVSLDRLSQPFSKVISQGSFRVVLVPDSVTRIVVKGESNILPHLYTISDGTTLTVGYQNGYNIHEHYPVEVFLHTPVLNSVKLSGSGMVECGSFNTGSVELELSGSGEINGNFNTAHLASVISGSGNIKLSGTAVNTSFVVSGSGNIDAKQLLQQVCSAVISGSGNITTNVAGLLNVVISGSGSVFYLGNPQITMSITGSGQLRRY